MSFEPIPQQIETHIQAAITRAQTAGDLPTPSELDGISVPVNRPKKDDQGDYAVPVAMALAKPFRMKPLDIANTIQQHLADDDLYERVEVAPPGFINIWLNPRWLQAQVENIIRAGETVFGQNIGQERKVNVEFVSANPTGPVHVGRTRGAVVGDSIARLLEACGWKVHREYYFNNGGRQMMLLGESLRARYLQALGQQAEVPEEGYQGDYLVAMAQKLKDEVSDSWQGKDWQPFKDYAENENFANIKATLKRIGVEFDLFFAELDLYEKAIWEVQQHLEAGGHLYQAVYREGASEEEIAKAERENAGEATWFRSTAFDDTEDRVLIRSNGEPTYVLPDVAYHVNKIERGFDRIIDIFGSDHFTEAQTVNRALQALGYDVSKIDVVITQWVHLLRGGEQVGMSTRKGEFVALDDLIDEIGSDAIRYFMLARSPDNTLNFDLDLAVKQSNENPVYYIQNAHVRCCGILRQVAERGYADNWDEGADLSLLNEDEMAFVRKLIELPEILVFAHDSLAAHQLAFWALDLARLFHPMYDQYRVLHGDVPDEVAKARLRLYRAAKVVFARVLTLMGMNAPERM